MFKIAWKDILHSKNNLLVLICLIISLIIPMVMFFISMSFMYAAERENERIFGSFDNVLYFADCVDDIQELDYFLSSIGTIEVLQTDFYGEGVNIGYVDETAIDLANIYILSGSWPSENSEIIVCNSLVYKNEAFYDIGSIITINGHDYTVSGIVNDYYTLWNKSENHGELTLPNILLCESSDTYGLSVLQKHLLLENSVPFPQNVYSDFSTLVFNSNRTENDTSGNYAIPSFVFILTSCCTVMLTVYVLSYYIEKEKQKLAILRCLGLTRTESFLYFAVKTFMLLLAAIPLGLILGYGVSIAAITVFNYLLDSEITLVYSLTHLAISVLICVVTTMVSIIASAYKLRNLSPLDQLSACGTLPSSKFKITTVSKKIRLLRLVRIEFHAYSNKAISAILMISFSLALFVMLSLYLDVYNARIREVPGQMPLTFDYEFLSDEKALETSYIDSSGNLVSLNKISFDGSVIYVPAHDITFPDKVLDALSNNPDVSTVNAYLEVNDLYLENSPSEADNEYLLGYPLDGELSQVLKSAFDVTSLTRGIQFFGFAEDELLQMDPYVIAGDINIEKIRSGEEIILMVPMYEIEQLAEGYTKQSFLKIDDYNEKENQHKDEFYSVGDTISFLQINCLKNGFSGYINEALIEQYLVCNRYSVKVGAIVCERIGWFDRMSQMPTAYTLIGLNESISNLNLHPTTSRIQIFLKSTTSYLEFDPVMRYYANGIEGFSFRNNAAEMDGYKKFQIIISAVCYTLNTLAMLVVIAITLIEEWVAFQQNKRYYMLLRLNGLTNGELLKIFITRSAVITLLGLCGGTIITTVLINNLYGNVGIITDYVNVMQIVSIVLSFMTVLICTPILIYSFEKKKPIAHLLSDF